MPLLSPAPRRALSVAAFAAASVGAGALVAAFVLARPPDPAAPRAATPPAAVAPAEGAGDYAQTYSPYCQTAQGVCALPSALPIGSACQCGSEPGRIIP